MDKRGKIHLFLGVAFLTFLSMVTIGWAIETTSIGEGRTRQEAINNGIRVAVEQALGTMVKSDTQVTNGKLIWDRIASASAGYVKNYNVLAEGKDPVTDVYKVKLTVTVDDYKLKGAVDDFLNDPRQQQIFQQTKFDERKVVVVYQPQTGFDLPYDSKGVQTIMGLIQDKLAEHGFRVFLPSQIKRIKGKSAEMVVDEETAIEIARQETGDCAVVVSLDGAKRPTNDGFYLLMCTLTLKAFDTSTGALFANVQGRDKTISRGGDYAIQDGISRAAIKIGPRAVERLVKKIVKRFSGPKYVTLIFRNISMKNQNKMEDILDELGWRTRVARQTGKYIEFEIIGEADPTSIRKIVRKEIKKAGLPLKSGEKVGYRITFNGDATGGY
ncbi:MAG: hypothetical protein JRD04_00900 [Deltaproteobacteria bacterium]|nr:hypothetical protein [Deltaproteobacteria bacterium]